jgi:hypothetical protein
MIGYSRDGRGLHVDTAGGHGKPWIVRRVPARRIFFDGQLTIDAGFSASAAWVVGDDTAKHSPEN